LPARLEALQAEIARAHRALSDPRLYSADPKAFTRATEALGRAELELAAAEQKWIELEMLREAAEGR
jgi:ATP-binding cassette subfamily F protein uup